jgi:TRAP-type C4-dicarboxylate transport system permease small subunit
MLARATQRLSAAVALLERAALMLLMAGIAAFVLMNVLLRGAGITIAWADEMAVYSMILSGFIGASLMLRGRIDPAVLLLHEFTPERGLRLLRIVISVVCVAFGLILLYTTWLWFDPLGLARAGFDVPSFEMSTFNFVYTDVTPIMGLPTFWFYLVMPWFGLTVTIHALANLVEDLGLVARPDNPARIDATEI